MKTLICSCIAVVLSISFLFAQNEEEDIFTDRSKTSLTCAWNMTHLFEGPGRKYRRKAQIKFGDRVKRMGKKAYVNSERRKYIQVKTEQGLQGWIYDFHFVNNGQTAVVLNRSRIYQEPRNRSSLTDETFTAGELLVRGNVSGDWVELYARDKEIRGWIKGQDRISTEKEQILAAQETQSTGARSLDDTYGRSSSSGSSSRFQAPSGGGYSFGNNSDNRDRGVVVGHMKSFLEDRTLERGSRARIARERSRKENSRGMENSVASSKDFQNTRASSSQSMMSERGKIYQINLPMEGDNVFVAYHKSLPIGSKIQVEFPDNGGFLELEIIGQMRSSMPEVLGLYPECLEILYGNRIPNQIKFSYPRK
ncbi:MAG: hypothetical protein AAF696_36315 [Bacteroidota bacterium]